jgi:hypothetical protein
VTPMQVTTIDVRELKEIELRCECGASVRINLPPKSGELMAEQKCPGCARYFWEGATDPTRRKLQGLIGSIENWQDAGNPVLNVGFVLTEPIVTKKPLSQTP